MEEGTTNKSFVTSSMDRDRAACREVAIEECIRLGLMPMVMKFFEGMGAGATQGSVFLCSTRPKCTCVSSLTASRQNRGRLSRPACCLQRPWPPLSTAG